jgi:hypothetical protein
MLMELSTDQVKDLLNLMIEHNKQLLNEVKKLKLTNTHLSKENAVLHKQNNELFAKAQTDKSLKYDVSDNEEEYEDDDEDDEKEKEIKYCTIDIDKLF